MQMNATLIKTSSKFGACINDFGVERCSAANLFWTSFPEMVSKPIPGRQNRTSCFIPLKLPEFHFCC